MLLYEDFDHFEANLALLITMSVANVVLVSFSLSFCPSFVGLVRGPSSFTEPSIFRDEAVGEEWVQLTGPWEEDTGTPITNYSGY